MGPSSTGVLIGNSGKKLVEFATSVEHPLANLGTSQQTLLSIPAECLLWVGDLNGVQPQVSNRLFLGEKVGNRAGTSNTQRILFVSTKKLVNRCFGNSDRAVKAPLHLQPLGDPCLEVFGGNLEVSANCSSVQTYSPTPFRPLALTKNRVSSS